MTHAMNENAPETPAGSQPLENPVSAPELEIDEEFQKLIPPLSDDEFANLRANLQADGVCLEPLVVWEAKNVLLGGHNRLKLCKELNIRWKTIGIPLKDREDAKAWIIRNQLGRRNLTPKWKHYYLGKEYEAAKQAHGGKRTPKAESGHEASKTVDALVEKLGVSASTINRSFAFVQAIDYLAEGDAEVRAKLLNDERSEAEIVNEAKTKKNPEAAQAIAPAASSATGKSTPKKGAKTKPGSKGGDIDEETTNDAALEDAEPDTQHDVDGESNASGTDGDDDEELEAEDDEAEFLRLPRDPKALAKALIEELKDEELAVIEQILLGRRQGLKRPQKGKQKKSLA